MTTDNDYLSEFSVMRDDGLVVSVYVECFDCEFKKIKPVEPAMNLREHERHKHNYICEKCGKTILESGSIIPYFDFEVKQQNKSKKEHQKRQDDGSKYNTEGEAGNKLDFGEGKKKIEKCFKYSNNGKMILHEAIIIDGKPEFVTHDFTKEIIRIAGFIEEARRIISPYDLDEYPNTPYEFDNEEQLNSYINRAKSETKDTLFNTILKVANRYIDQDKNIFTQLAVDAQITYAQDKFSTIHYSLGVGSNEVGKSAIGFFFEGIAYRPVKGTSISAANYYRLLGTVEPGQVTIIEDEADGIDEDKEKMKILKNGYEFNGKTARINMNEKDQKQHWYNTFCFKFLLAENSPRVHKARGVLDRTFEMRLRPGKPKERVQIKDVLTAKLRLGNVSENSRELELYNEIDDLRKLLFCHRLIHHHELLPDIETGLEGRNAELANPILRYYFGCVCIDKVKESLAYFLNQRKQRSANTVEAAIYLIIRDSFISKGILEVSFKEIWNQIRRQIPHVLIGADNKNDGKNDFERDARRIELESEGYVPATSKERVDPTKHVTEDYGVLYYSTVSDLVFDKFASGKKKSKTGIVIRFDKNKIDQFESRYGKDEPIEINLRLKTDNGDGGDGGDGNRSVCNNLPMSDADNHDRDSNTSSKMTTIHPLLVASPASPASPPGDGNDNLHHRKFKKCPKKTCRFENQHQEEIIHHIRYTDDHTLSLLSEVEGGDAITAKMLGLQNKTKVLNSEDSKQLASQKAYNSILILNARKKVSKSLGIKYNVFKYGCNECQYKSIIYGNVYDHKCREHFRIYVEAEYLENSEYLEALKILDNNADIKFADPSFTTFELEVAREIFVKLNSLNQQYFKKLLPSDDDQLQLLTRHHS